MRWRAIIWQRCKEYSVDKSESLLNFPSVCSPIEVIYTMCFIEETHSFLLLKRSATPGWELLFIVLSIP